jgi:hypothetical protein
VFIHHMLRAPSCEGVAAAQREAGGDDSSCVGRASHSGRADSDASARPTDRDSRMACAAHPGRMRGQVAARDAKSRFRVRFARLRTATLSRQEGELCVAGRRRCSPC